MPFVKLAVLLKILPLFMTTQTNMFSQSAKSNEKLKTHSCAADIAKSHFNNKYPIEVITGNDYNSNLIQTLLDVHITTVVLRKLNATHARKESVNNYILEVENIVELKMLAELQLDLNWNPTGKFIVIFRDDKQNLDVVFETLFKQHIINVVVLVWDATYITTNVFSYSPYDNGSCGREPAKSKFLTGCNEEDVKLKYMFPDKVRGAFIDCTVDVATHIFPPYTVYASGKTSRRLMGIEGTMLEELSLMEKFKINYTVLKSVPDFGVIVNGKNATGLLSNLQNGRAEIVLGGYILSNDRRVLFDYLNADLQDAMAILVPRASPIEKWKNIFLTFRYEIIVGVFISYIIFSLVLYKINQNSILKCDSFSGLINTFFICWGVMFCNAINAVNVDNKKLRLIFITWLGYCGFLGACYQSVLFSILARTIYTHQIENYEDLLQSGLKLSVDRQEWARMKNNEDPMVNMFKDRVTVVPTLAESVSLVIKDKNHFMLYTYSNYKSELTSFSTEDGYLLTFELGLKYNSYDVAMYTVKGFPLRARFQAGLRRFHAFGLTNKWRDDVFSHLNVNKKPQSQPLHIQLAMSHLTGCFYILFIGISMSVISFLFELKQNCTLNCTFWL